MLFKASIFPTLQEFLEGNYCEVPSLVDGQLLLTENDELHLHN